MEGYVLFVLGQFEKNVPFTTAESFGWVRHIYGLAVIRQSGRLNHFPVTGFPNPVDKRYAV
jgi:hypothetical protein